ncbi:hypothetical protein J437_LFUL013045 [Ladona fulva]|uniref:Kinesin-like protein n=1 Tax=Ladona fulva TaxID=123851 RepID=A0A8K0P3B2_LADFU|nr:hypothetical protein J437_LFUL013045 [Ladona fulva]
MWKPQRKYLDRKNSLEKDPVEVYCRVKPLDSGVGCIKVLDSKTVLVTTPDFNIRGIPTTNFKEIQYTFQHVFDEKCTQKEVFDSVAYPLIEALISGKNGLLFTYGVSGSGKTFTMNGAPDNGGILPRCFDVLFNSISHAQARKYVFKPDRMNGFDVQSNVDAMMEIQRDMLQAQRAPKTPRKIPSDVNLEDRVPDLGKITEVDDDCLYTVFVSHVEIYNNHIYDLLDDILEEGGRPKLPQSKILREDANHNMFVHGVNEVEVTSTEEAFEVYYKGQKRKRMAHTCLNAESSRSHSVFTLRLVQAPLNSSGDEVLQEKNIVCISQLSLVDLAGSERTNRTKNSGQRLREAGNINNSLLTLRTCFEILRENQMNGTSKVVPYRQSRLTHLFKNYFDGEGKVKMIVCVNPIADDYDETIHVLKFADMSKEIQVTRPIAMKLDLGLTPGRRRVNLNIRDENGNQALDSSPELGLVYSLGPEFPPLVLSDPNQADLIKNLMSFLEVRLGKRNVLQKELLLKHKNFRSRLVEIEKENVLAKQELASVKATLEVERRKSSLLESKLVNLESSCTKLEWKVQEKNNEISVLKKELDSVTAGLSQKVVEKEREKQRMKQRMLTEKQRANKEIQQKQKELTEEFKTQIRRKDEKLRLVKEIISNDSAILRERNNLTPSSSEGDLRTADLIKKFTPSMPQVSWALSADSPATSKQDGPLTRRMSRSVSNVAEIWLDHRPVTSATPLNTVLQPRMKKRKSVTKLTDAKDVANSKSSKYCLTTQEADSAGEVETRLYKGDIIPTTGGGAQVIFNDVETLRQVSPTKTTPLKRRSDEMTYETRSIVSYLQ